jgi:HAD superfamily hydrolase (TIGR01549 family)
MGFEFETVLLDVDGTLIDSNAAHAEAWTQALREHGLAVEIGQIRPLIGMGADKLLPTVASVSEDSTLGQAMGRRKKAIGTQLVIATSADDREMEALLQRAGVDDLLPQRASKDDASESKPDPDIVHAALARSSARPESSVIIGDTPYDIEAARRAGIGAIALRCGGHWSDGDLHDAVAIFDDPAALLARWRGDAR